MSRSPVATPPSAKRAVTLPGPLSTDTSRAPCDSSIPRRKASACNAAFNSPRRRHRYRRDASSASPSGTRATSAPWSSSTRIARSGKPRAVTASEASSCASARIPLLAKVRNAPTSSAVSGCASCTATSNPALCRASAVAVPAIPPPMTSMRVTWYSIRPRRSPSGLRVNDVPGRPGVSGICGQWLVHAAGCPRTEAQTEAFGRAPSRASSAAPVPCGAASATDGAPVRPRSWAVTPERTAQK